jgi:hypothetical protein
MTREITTHLIPDLPDVAELRVFAGEGDKHGVPHFFNFRSERGDDIFTIPLQSGDPRNSWNGLTTLSVLAALRDFLERCQASKFACEENRLSINYLEAVIEQLKTRIRRRVAEQTMHTHQAGAGEKAAQ